MSRKKKNSFYNLIDVSALAGYGPPDLHTTMKVTFKTGVAGTNFSYVGGQTYDLPKDIALGWIRRGTAAPAKDAPKPIETATLPQPKPAERATMPAPEKPNK